MRYIQHYLIITTCLLLLGHSSSQECQRVQCTSIPDENTCILPEGTVSKFQQCPSGKTCNIPSEDPIDKATCGEPVPKTYLLLPGLPCESNSQCISNICEDKQCKGVKENEACTKVEDCEYGFTCRKINTSDTNKVCAVPLSQNDVCEFDTDCSLQYGCYNGKCTHYFTLTDGQFIGTTTTVNPILSLCQSGYSDDSGICQTLTQQNEKTECSEANPCKYTYGDKTLILPENCLCGYNPQGTQYCLLGSGDSTYQTYIDKLKSYYLSNKNCHISERGGDGCLKDILSTDESIQQTLQQLYNAKVEALYNNRLYDVDSCVLAIELPDYKPSHAPLTNNKCGVYKCADDKTNCASTSIKDGQLEVNLSNICKANEICHLGNEPNVAFYINEEQQFQCAEVTVDKRYPGEECSSDLQCFYPVDSTDSAFHTCKDSKCTGKAKDETCKTNEECVVGLYCDTTDNKCKEQKALNVNCTNTYECKNSLLCYENKCQDVMYSFESGTSVAHVSENNKEIYCQFGTVISGICVEITDENENEFRECKYGEKCLYTYSPSKYGPRAEDCECGYNAEGKAYCPKFHNYKRDEWKKYYQAIKKSYDNKCHSLNRGSCYIKNENLDKEISYYRNTLEHAHLFHNSVSCAEAVLASGYLKFSLIGVIAVVMMGLI